MSLHSGNVEPYLSVVVTTRNDDHGGDPLKRLQALVNTFDRQCRRNGLDAELIVVEWNPPPEKPSVASLLRLPDPAFATYRFIDVPPELHQRLQYADVLPLFQMIAKNVGIRRARGQFVLATNIDIIFSTELIAYLATRPLQPGRMYRVDRHDILSDFPLDAPLETEMAYCATHQVRVHTPQGSYAVDPHGTHVSLDDDIVDGRVIRLGQGWHVREGGSVGPFYRWASDRTTLIVDWAQAPPGTSMLELDVESNPYDPRSWVRIEAFDDERAMSPAHIAGRMRLQIPLATCPTGYGRIELRVAETCDNFRGQLPVFERRDALHYRVHSVQLRSAVSDEREQFEYRVDGWTNAYPDSGVTVSSASEGVRVATDPRKWSYCVHYLPLQAPSSGTYEFSVGCTVHEGRINVGALSGSRSAWIHSSQTVQQDGTFFRFGVGVDLRRGEPFWLMIYNDHPDAEAVSRFTIQSLIGSAAPEGMVIPEGSRVQTHPMFERAARLSAAIARRVRTIWASVRSIRRWRERFSLILDRLANSLAAVIGARFRGRIVRAAPEYRTLLNALRTSDEQLRALAPLNDLAGLHKFLRERRPDNLHVNGCGDFQLMAREHWEDLRAYPEFETFSMNIDGLFGYIADAAGIKQEILPMPIYHLEHEVGSGWSPEGEALLRKRIAERGITWLDASTVYIWAAYMKWLGRPMIFNRLNWGLSDSMLPETIHSPASSPASH